MYSSKPRKKNRKQTMYNNSAESIQTTHLLQLKKVILDHIHFP